ncbi:MAG: GatB/YqeY domain-containing protein [Candidatus Paceibacterota bacterium]|jgi:hypothetical protein
MLQDTIKQGIKDAMLAKNTVKLAVMRALTAAFTNEAITLKVEKLTDEQALAIIRRGVKQRKDSIEQFTKGGRADLADSEIAELKILETFLPQMMSKDDIRKIAEAKKTELSITDKTKAGILMSTLMKELKGKAEGADVKSVVEEILN